MSFVDSQFRFRLTSTTYVDLVAEARRFAEVNFPEWDFDSPVDLGRFALDIYLRAQVQQIEIANGWSQEAFLSACRLRQSAVAHAVSRGYNPSNPTPSVGPVSIQFDSSASARNVPQFALRFSSRNVDRNNPIFFENANSFTIPALTTVMEVDLVAGRSYEQIYEGSGDPDQLVTLGEWPVIDNSVSIVDDLDNEYTQVPDFVDSLPTDRHFIIQLLSNGQSQAVFGDDTKGEAVPSGRTLTISYRVGGGLETNVEPDSIQTTEQTISGVTVVSVNNLEKFQSGNEEESLASIKVNAPAAFRRKETLSRLTEIDDFARAYNGVARGFSYLFAANSVYTSVVPDGGGNPSESLRSALQAAINEKIIMGFTDQCINPLYATATIEVEFTTRAGFDSAETENVIQQAILNNLNPTTTKTVNARQVFVRAFGESLKRNTISSILQGYVTSGAIEEDFEIIAPATDVTINQDQIFTDTGSSVTATSRNTRVIEYE